MPSNLNLDYYYGTEAEQYSFYRVPKTLLTDPRYWRSSARSVSAMCWPLPFWIRRGTSGFPGTIRRGLLLFPCLIRGPVIMTMLPEATLCFWMGLSIRPGRK